MKILALILGSLAVCAFVATVTLVCIAAADGRVWAAALCTAVLTIILGTASGIADDLH